MITKKQLYYQENKEKIKQRVNQYYYENKEKLLNDMSLYAKEHKEIVNRAKKKYKSRNKAKFAALEAKRRSLLKKACPKWANLHKIEEIYKQANVLVTEVDHIIPLVSPIVCGLHVEANLQLLSRTENRSKGNRMTYSIKSNTQPILKN